MATPSRSVRPLTWRSPKTVPWRGVGRARSLRHLRPCATIPSPVRPSRVLWNNPRRCGALFRWGAAKPGPVQHKRPHQQDPWIDVRTATRRGRWPDYPRSYTRRVQKPPRHLREPGSTRTPIKSQALRFGTTILYKKSCDTSVSRLPLAYKRRWRSPGRGDRMAFIRTHPHAHSPDILALCFKHLAGSWRLFLLFHLACSPPLQAPWCIAIQRTSAICWTYGPAAGTRINPCPRIA
jgi:hypothetical protein